ncbi:related to hsp70 protein [Fusarium fujikuroi]|nr:related to hsp70 protein [Fusarium fujikuroi]
MPSFQTPSKLVVAIDFGETNSSVSYAFLPEGVRPESPHLTVRTVQNYRYEISMRRGNSMCLEVPTLMRYPNDWVFQTLDELRSEPPDTSLPENDRVQLGFQVQHYMTKVMSHSDKTCSLLYGFKNLMNQSESHEVQNRHLVKTLRRLSQNHSCSREISIHDMVLLVTIDYLTNLLSHAKTEITGSTNITSTELVICVPVIWRQKALRGIQACVAIAARRVNFLGVDFGNDCVTQVFMITEPEAAATWLLSNRLIVGDGDVFTILDAGGGTCDALTYTVTRSLPLRLERQLVHHSVKSPIHVGNTCGSNALNDAFGRLLENLLADHDYLNESGATLEGHIYKLAIHDFEHHVKPVWVVSQNNQDYQLEVLGLRSDPGSQRPCTNRLAIQAGNLNNIYQHVCEEVSMLMTKQLHAIAQLGLKTGKVVLVGGFGESAPLRSHLHEALANFDAAHDSNAQLYVADEHERRSENRDLKTDVAHLLHPQFLVKNEGAQGPSCDDGRNLYWKFPYELVLTIDGLNMKYVQAFEGQEIGAMRVEIAPGFAPGAN